MCEIIRLTLDFLVYVPARDDYLNPKAVFDFRILPGLYGVGFGHQGSLKVQNLCRGLTARDLQGNTVGTKGGPSILQDFGRRKQRLNIAIRTHTTIILVIMFFVNFNIIYGSYSLWPLPA